MKTISIIEEKKNYVIVKIPRSMMQRAGFEQEKLPERAALNILRQGMSEYKARKTKPLKSLRELRYGN